MSGFDAARSRLLAFQRVATRDPPPRQDDAMNSEVVHQRVTCDLGNQNIVGRRYKCVNCPDFDLCQNCEALPVPVHPETHPLLN